MKDTERELSPRYYIAEGSIWLFIAILLVSRFIGLAPDQALPVLSVNVGNIEYYPRVVAALLLAAVFYMVVEWKQSAPTARDTNWQRIRLSFTGLSAAASLWISYPIIAQNTQFAAVSPAWYLGFAAIGFFLGLFGSVLAFSALMTRSLEESKRLRLPRVPAASRAQFFTWTPAILLLMVAYYVLISFSPPVIRGIAGALVVVPFILMIGKKWKSLYLARDDNGKRIPYLQRMARLKEIYDFHDYAYFLMDEGERATKELDIPAPDSPQAVQQAIQKNYSAAQAQTPVKFRAQLLEAMQLRFYPKDGNPRNYHAENCGVGVSNHQGRKEQVRVLFIPEDSGDPKKEMAISCAAVEKYAEEYIRDHADQQNMSSRKIVSHAVNRAVMEAIVDDGGPRLHRLVESGEETRVAELLKQKPDVNERAEAGWTPLLYASAQGYPRIVHMLLDAGANPDIGNALGITPLIYSARYGNAEVCQVLLDYEADVDLQDVYGMSALMVACRDGHSEIVKLLLDARANPKIETREGKTALDFCYACGHGRIAKTLKRANKSIQHAK